MAKMLGLLALGGLFSGTATSLTNSLGTPFLSQFLGMGWSWAAVGVPSGWVALTRRVAWVGATCTLLAAVPAYYATDLARGVYDTIDPADPSFFRVTTSWTGALSDLSYWWVAAFWLARRLASSATRSTGPIGWACSPRSSSRRSWSPIFSW